MPSDPFADLGTFLTATEAVGIAVQLSTGQHSSVALREVNPARREKAKELMSTAGLGHDDVDRSSAVLHAIARAKSLGSQLTPVWMMPGNEATAGRLTGEFTGSSKQLASR